MHFLALPVMDLCRARLDRDHGRGRCGVTVLSLLIIGFLPPLVLAAASEGYPPASVWSLEAKLKGLFSSHTSYEFGNPVTPYQSPLSRLEFPINSVWGGLEGRGDFSLFSAGVEFLTSVADQESGNFRDRDWNDNEVPQRLTNYGETDTRLLPSYQLRADIVMPVAALLRLPDRFDLSPVAGFRWQQLNLTPHDGTQFDYPSAGDPPEAIRLPGDAIRFQQNWYQYFLGLKIGYDFGSLAGLSRLRLQSQLDWGYTYGENVDNHLLREAKRITTDATTGDAWHASLAVV
ncbi:MAG: omptin family outer membrane protease, partial [Gammaproteobacteria bacterium]|nr:omptin family outer membrane protease [Gammaproteobacteria bacterium]